MEKPVSRSAFYKLWENERQAAARREKGPEELPEASTKCTGKGRRPILLPEVMEKMPDFQSDDSSKRWVLNRQRSWIAERRELEILSLEDESKKSRESLRNEWRSIIAALPDNENLGNTADERKKTLENKINVVRALIDEASKEVARCDTRHFKKVAAQDKATILGRLHDVLDMKSLLLGAECPKGVAMPSLTKEACEALVVECSSDWIRYRQALDVLEHAKEVAAFVEHVNESILRPSYKYQTVLQKEIDRLRMEQKHQDQFPSSATEFVVRKIHLSQELTTQIFSGDVENWSIARKPFQTIQSCFRICIELERNNSGFTVLFGDKAQVEQAIQLLSTKPKVHTLELSATDIPRVVGPGGANLRHLETVVLAPVFISRDNSSLSVYGTASHLIKLKTALEDLLKDRVNRLEFDPITRDEALYVRKSKKIKNLIPDCVMRIRDSEGKDELKCTLVLESATQNSDSMKKHLRSVLTNCEKISVRASPRTLKGVMSLINPLKALEHIDAGRGGSALQVVASKLREAKAHVGYYDSTDKAYDSIKVDVDVADELDGEKPAIMVIIAEKLSSELSQLFFKACAVSETLTMTIRQSALFNLEYLRRFASEEEDVQLRYGKWNRADNNYSFEGTVTLRISGDRYAVARVGEEISKALEVEYREVTLNLLCPRLTTAWMSQGAQAEIMETEHQCKIYYRAAQPEMIISGFEVSIQAVVDEITKKDTSLYEEEKEHCTEEIPLLKEKRKFYIGPKGATLRHITSTTDCEIELNDDKGIISISGKPENVSVAKVMLNAAATSPEPTKSVGPTNKFGGIRYMTDEDMDRTKKGKLNPQTFKKANADDENDFPPLM